RKWCTSCPKGACSGSSCTSENDCRINQREIFAAANCSEVSCEASDCPKCMASGKCMWTWQFKRTMHEPQLRPAVVHGRGLRAAAVGGLELHPRVRGGPPQCSRCLRQPCCGWCTRGRHTGSACCLEGGLHGPRHGMVQVCGAEWVFLGCPAENECPNGHHDCNKMQDCHDLPHGFCCASLKNPDIRSRS
ncbi:LOW QUALITY PROTEIN: multiple epidermal growth factor-like domains protein 8, partial [Morus bassanus]